MKLPTEIFGKVIVIHAPERIGRAESEAIGDFLIHLERNKLVLDLDGSEAFDSQGLESLLDAQDALRVGGGDIKLSTKNHVNRKILEITRLDQRLEVFNSVIEAVKSYA